MAGPLAPVGLDTISTEQGAMLIRGLSRWIAFAPGADGSLLSSNSSGPAWLTLSAALDLALGDTPGSILIRGASDWQLLTPGTDAQVLTLASGAPSWADTMQFVSLSQAAYDALGTYDSNTIYMIPE